MTERIGDIIKRLRAARGESLEAVAKGAGTSKGHVWEIENGGSDNPTLHLLKGLSRHFLVPIDTFTGEVLPEKTHPLWHVWDAMLRLDDRDIRIVEALIVALDRRRHDEAAGSK